VGGEALAKTIVDRSVVDKGKDAVDRLQRNAERENL
jgi:hypothetical protein